MQVHRERKEIACVCDVCPLKERKMKKEGVGEFDTIWRSVLEADCRQEAVYTRSQAYAGDIVADTGLDQSLKSLAIRRLT